MIVVACNSASSNSMSILRSNYSVPVIGVISPSAVSAINCSISGRIGVIGTYATILSGAYLKILQKQKHLKIIQKPCPLFVPLVEEGMLRHRVTRAIGEEYLSPIIAFKADTLILGCTHYPILKPVIQEIMGNNVLLIDPAIETAKTVKEYLNRNNLSNHRNTKGSVRYFVSDFPRNFNSIAKMFLGVTVRNVKTINIEQFSKKLKESSRVQTHKKK